MKGIVDGKEVVLPVNEVQTRLQKDVASEQRFSQAAAKEAEITKREAEIARQTKFWELTQRSEAGDAAATEEALRMLGKDPAQYMGNTGGQTRQSAPVQLPPEVAEVTAFLQAAKSEGIDPLVALRYAQEGASTAIRTQVRHH